MSEPTLPPSSVDEQASQREIVRLNKIVRALMDRAERSTSLQSSDFSLFQTAIMLEEQVLRRTAELEAVLRENEKINRALRESESKFRAMVSQSLVGICIVENGKFSYSNLKFDEIFGYSSDEVLHLGPLDVASEDNLPSVVANIHKRLNGDVGQNSCVFRGVRKNCTVIDIEIHSSAMEIGGKPALISLVMDVTERARAEREVQVLQDRLRDESTRDALTGLYNRRYLEETFGRELILAERHGSPVSVIMSDIDYFKAVNDHYGHLGGDEVLRAFGTLMRRQARGSDMVCRYGGEEFLLVLPQMTMDDAVERAEQLRSAIAAAPIPYGTALIEVTASFGIATFPGGGRTIDELIGAADRALYAAKAAGRNRVERNSDSIKSQ